MMPSVTSASGTCLGNDAFGVRSFPKWIVFTGAVGSGKTTTASLIRGFGYHTVEEAGSEVIVRLINMGVSPFDDTHGLQTKIFSQSIMNLIGLPKDNVIVFDRGLHDSLAYFEYFRLDELLPRQICAQVRYGLVFHFEQIDRLQGDDIRPEYLIDDGAWFSSRLHDIYREYMHNVIHVPVMECGMRAEFVRQRIKGYLGE